MIKKTAKNFAYRAVLPYAGLLLVRMISATYRRRIVDPRNESDVLDAVGSLVYASWHQRFFPGITFFASRKPIAIMISRSRDGEVISRVVDILGWRSVRGSSSRGGSEALKTLKRLSVEGYKIGHIVDGPKGPHGVIKPGLITIAQFAQIPVVPTIISAQRRWVFNSWDRFMIPKPFSRVIIRFGEPIFIPRKLDAESFEDKRRFVERKMHELYTEADRMWDDEAAIKKIF